MSSVLNFNSENQKTSNTRELRLKVSPNPLSTESGLERCPWVYQQKQGNESN